MNAIASRAENQVAVQQTTPNHDTDEGMTLSAQSFMEICQRRHSMYIERNFGGSGVRYTGCIHLVRYGKDERLVSFYLTQYP